MSSDVHPGWHTLLPIYAVGVRMRFTEPARPGFFHQAALTAWLRTILGSPDDYGLHLCCHAPEQGRSAYRAGDYYRFTLFGCGARGLELLRMLPGAIRANRGRFDRPMPFRNNWRLDRLEQWSSGEERTAADAPALALDQTMVAASTAALRQSGSLTLRLISPWRVLRAREQRRQAKGEMRYCHDGADLAGGLWLTRIDDALRRLVEEKGGTPPPPPERAPEAELQLFYVNSAYRKANGAVQPMGGLLGEINIKDVAALPEDTVALLLIGSLLGVGQRRVFGLGRYRVLSPSLELPHSCGAVSGWLERAMAGENLRTALQAVAEGAEREADSEQPPDDNEISHLEKLASRLLRGDYQPPAMHGFIHHDADGGIRPLAAPPFSDRVLQRALHQVLAPSLDLLMDAASYGYRAGHSRFQVRDLLQRLHREGYRWIFESDIRTFFDSVAWSRLALRLACLLNDPPLQQAILHWMAAPVIWQGKRISRSQGLPQGSPLSPLMANLMLDDFDHDLTDAGCRLVRFADDFVIVAKKREQAEQAGELARKSLREAGLELNLEKTRVVSFSEGFRFLGFMFVDGLAVEAVPRPVADGAKPPADSWLARAINEEESVRDQLLRGEAPIPVATYAEGGQMLLFCGEPAVLFTRNGRVRIERDDDCLAEMPWSHLDGIVLFGRHHLTTPAILEAMAHQVSIHLASSAGDYRGMIVGANTTPQAELWQRQLACCHDDGRALTAAQSLVDARLRHMRETLRRRTSPGVEQATASISRMLRDLQDVRDREQLNGVEGAATRAYFAALREMVPEEYGFTGRNRRPPRDPFNALLSLGYTTLYAYADTLLRADGLLPEYGVYHQPRGGHAALASDMMEPFRHLVERCALAMVQRGRLKVDDFDQCGDQGCRMRAPARRLYLTALCELLLQPVTAIGGGEAMTPLDHLHRQNLALKFWLAGKATAFQAWRMR